MSPLPSSSSGSYHVGASASRKAKSKPAACRGGRDEHVLSQEPYFVGIGVALGQLASSADIVLVIVGGGVRHWAVGGIELGHREED